MAVTQDEALVRIDELEGGALDAVLPEAGAAWLRKSATRLAEGTPIAHVLPALARNAGRAALADALVEHEGCRLQRAAWRACDAAGRGLLRAARVDDDALVDLFLHGDFEERCVVLRNHAAMPIRPSTIELLGEVQRSNTDAHFEALVCDSNLLARAMRSSDFEAESGYKILLKGAFVGLPLDRFDGVLEHASPELSAYVLGLATEREAAGRAIWPDTVRVLAHAPIPGTHERVARGLGDADPGARFAAAQALTTLVARGDEGAAELVRDALAATQSESDPRVRALLSAAREAAGA